ncbi:acyl-CoA dehydrogenase family protein [Micromonospora sp. WMMD998]|uniref:acyl-CoA dehydrogenase family protein n=1 Tax=Micromonospora sp. WMMD998 TaxID=3016092 RepID=UPI002499FE70|nr:acyl-CoA dehydrogenase family protein [Micromonospora sp. WMMD998]WFE41119.1 acyl-CoA dehydrogenase family protein [Micromonospora sp. WMMD998]
MDFRWSKDQIERYDTVLRQARERLASTSGIGTGEHQMKGWRLLADLGTHGWCVPAEYGGSGLGALDTARLVEALGRGCPDTGLVFGASAQSFSCTMPLVRFGRAALRDRLLPGICAGDVVLGHAMTEADSGSDVSRLAVTARRVPEGWVLDGEKTFVSNGPVADMFIVYATTDPAAGHLGISAFVVDRGTAGVTPGPAHRKMGLEGCLAGGLRLDGCFVPDEQVLGVPGQGTSIFKYGMAWERTCLFAGYLGLGDRVLQRAIEHARDRRQFGRPLSGFQAVTHRIADMAVHLESARLLLYRACWCLDEGQPATIEVAMAKLAVSENVLATTLSAVRLFGARGYTRDDGIEAALRDTVPGTIFSGTSDIQREIITKELGL